MPTDPFPTPCPPTPAARLDPFHPLAKVHALLCVGFLLLFGMPARVDAQVTNRWTGTGDGTTWNLASNWQLGRVPTTTDIAVIDLDGTNTVVRITGISAAVRNLTSTATLVLDGGELAVSQGTNHLTGPLHASLSAIGATERRGAALASYLLFESSYTRSLIELGQIDTLHRRDEVLRFFGALTPSAVASGRKVHPI